MSDYLLIYIAVGSLVLLTIIGSIALILWYKHIYRNETRNTMNGGTGNTSESKFESGPGKDDPGKAAFESRDFKEVLIALNDIRSLLEQNMTVARDTADSNREFLQMFTHEMQRINAESRALNDGALKNFYALFDRCISRLDDLNENLSMRQGSAGGEMSSAYEPVEKGSIESIPSGRLRSIPSSVESGRSTSFDQLISGNIDKIVQASTGGRKDIEPLVRQLAEQFPVELEIPSDNIFIIVSREAGITRGKAFVFPGSYLGRPWVDWFEMPSGVFERVESTVMPATVSKAQFENWNLDKNGLVSQH